MAVMSLMCGGCGGSVAVTDEQRGKPVRCPACNAAFWAPPGFAHPFGLDWFDPGAGPDRVEVGAALLPNEPGCAGPRSG